MVRAIRFWGTAARLIADDPHNARGREVRCVPTRRGRALFGEGGWDPYMEDPGALWLLHAPRVVKVDDRIHEQVHRGAFYKLITGLRDIAWRSGTRGR